MNEPARQYREMMRQWEIDRIAAGGSLSQEEEARRAGEIDRHWMQMSEDEQEEYEVEIKLKTRKE